MLPQKILSELVKAYPVQQMTAIVAVDLGTFVLAFAALLFLVRIPEQKQTDEEKREDLLPFRASDPLFVYRHKETIDM